MKYSRVEKILDRFRKYPPLNNFGEISLLSETCVLLKDAILSDVKTDKKPLRKIDIDSRYKKKMKRVNLIRRRSRNA
jgi:hypothetical protein